MARTVRARREAYDNIAVGSAITSKERIINGALAPAETFANGENIAVGTDYGADENIVVSGTNLLTGERLG